MTYVIICLMREHSLSALTTLSDTFQCLLFPMCSRWHQQCRERRHAACDENSMRAVGYYTTWEYLITLLSARWEPTYLEVHGGRKRVCSASHEMGRTAGTEGKVRISTQTMKLNAVIKTLLMLRLPVTCTHSL